MRNYSRKKKELCLQKKVHKISSEEICIGNDIEIINNPRYNLYLHNRLKYKYGHKTNGCEIEITEVKPISEHGYSLQKF